jgi:hypothetical protein
MKKITLFALMLVASFGLKAQVMYSYTFTNLTATYTDLVGSTNLTAGNAWDDTLMTIPLGFTFKWAIANRNIDSIVIDSYGMMYAPQDFDANLEIGTRLMMPFQADLADRGYNNSTAAVSPISYVTTGTAGSRICKIEFKNAGFYSDQTSLDSTNFQIWLYENSNIIEFRYGPSFVADLATSFDSLSGPAINLIYNSTINIANLIYNIDTCTYISGNAATPFANNPTTSIDLNNPPANFTFVGLPNNGQVFRFAPIGVSSSVSAIEKAFATVNVYPTKIENNVTIEHEGQQLSARITDINGQVILEEKNIQTNTKLNTSILSQGIYFLTLIDQQKLSKTYKLVK